ncbi:MAG: hypothetical protein IJM93_05595 [Oscillospiraceae bacterium]|nr:hypothetical protein [Oscillospiraceae bacterium]
MWEDSPIKATSASVPLMVAEEDSSRTPPVFMPYFPPVISPPSRSARRPSWERAASSAAEAVIL